MKIDTHEMHALSQAPAGRMDLYVTIHKGLRAFMSDTLVRVGRMDVDDPQEVDRVCAQVMALAGLCRSHLEHENTFVHPALQARCPGVADQAGQDHLEHEVHIESLAASAQALRHLPAPQRNQAALALYRDLALFMADNLEHMHLEETRHTEALWKSHTDAEIGDVHARLVASIPPAEMMQALRWMIPALTPAERVEVLGGMRAAAPEPVFRAVLDGLQPHLDAPGWTRLCRSFGLPPAPGLAA